MQPTSEIIVRDMHANSCNKVYVQYTMSCYALRLYNVMLIPLHKNVVHFHVFNFHCLVQQ